MQKWHVRNLIKTNLTVDLLCFLKVFGKSRNGCENDAGASVLLRVEIVRIRLATEKVIGHVLGKHVQQQHVCLTL